MKNFKAPWCTALIVVSILATLLCFGIVFGTPLLPQPKQGGEFGMWFRWLLFVLIPVCALFTIRGYSITPDAILVHRLLWSTRLPRTGLQSACYDPNATRWSIRTCGNGGFFSFTGWYWNKKLGAYRAFVTDPSQIVVLRYDRHTIVLSPEEPEEFVRTLMSE